MSKILIETYGCTLNQADSGIMKTLLTLQGHEVTEGKYDSRKQDYDCVIVNTCTVKTPTEQKILHRLKEAKEKGNKLIVTGCMASANKDIIFKTVPNASLLSTSNVSSIAYAVSEIEKGRQVILDKYNSTDKMLFYGMGGAAGTIAKIPISEGCLSSCSFCETKYARGPLNSFSEELIIKAVQTCVNRGAKEIELTSQDTGAYGRDKKTNIAELVSKISGIEGDFKVRIGMLNPEHLNKYFDQLLDTYKSEKIYKFIHLPVQSGSNRVLRDMKRNYTIEEFEGYVKEIKEKVKGIGIETDVIVGYPTESSEDFEQSNDMLERIKPMVTNISKFGSRPHAVASKLKQIGNLEMKKRSTEMARKVRAMQKTEREKLIGSVQKALITENNGTSLLGRNAGYMAIAVNGSHAKIGSYIDVKITGATSACVIGNEV